MKLFAAVLISGLLVGPAFAEEGHIRAPSMAECIAPQHNALTYRSCWADLDVATCRRAALKANTNLSYCKRRWAELIAVLEKYHRKRGLKRAAIRQ